MTTRAPRIHTADYIAWYKHITGEWQYNFAAGEIHNTRTGKPVKFHKNSNGYLTTAVRIHNTTTHILKHRAIWIAAHGILALPLDYTLEIHHKNHNPADCRIHNLQLVTLPQNRKNPHRTHGPIPPETVRELRSRRKHENISIQKLADEYALSKTTVHRLITNKTYQNIQP